MTYTPLCAVSDLTSTPLADIVRNFSSAQQTALVTRASRAVEGYCGARLSPFTVTESFRAQAVDPDEQAGTNVPLDTVGMLGISRAQSLGSTDLVRHVWVRERPRVWLDQWVGALSSVVVLRSFSGAQTVTASSLQYETDTGHIRFAFGTYVPQGSTLVVTYSGGYNPIPDELIQAAIWKATEIALIDLEPQARPEINLAELRESIATILSPYVVD